jgi:drug/metabolite transporter (DMT)-like permease
MCTCFEGEFFTTGCAEVARYEPQGEAGHGRPQLFIGCETPTNVAAPNDRLGSNRAVHASLMLLVLFWGLAFVAIKQALVHMSWITLTFLRFALADILYIGYLAATRRLRPLPARKDLPHLALLAFVGFTGYHLFLNLGESNASVTAGTAALIIASTPAFIAVLAASLLHERLKPFQAAGIVLAFAGLGVMIFLARPESQFRFQASEGALAVIPSAVFSALYAVFGKRYLGRYPPVTLVTWTLLIGTALLLPLVAITAPAFIKDLQVMGIDGWVPVLFLAVFPTFLGYVIWFRALARLPAASAAAYIYASTLVAVVGGIAILGEPLTPATAVGGAMVIAGVLAAQRLRGR